MTNDIKPGDIVYQYDTSFIALLYREMYAAPKRSSVGTIARSAACLVIATKEFDVGDQVLIITDGRMGWAWASYFKVIS